MRESEATSRFVHLAIVYQADGRVIGYRNGKQYGEAYQSNGPFEFKAGNTIVSFGVRHLPAGGNRLLTGRIQLAQLYDRALSAEEIAATSIGAGVYVSDPQVLASLSMADRERVTRLRSEIDQWNRQLESIGPIPDAFGERELWTDLSRAMFMFKEFIYVR